MFKTLNLYVRFHQNETDNHFHKGMWSTRIGDRASKMPQFMHPDTTAARAFVSSTPDPGLTLRATVCRPYRAETLETSSAPERSASKAFILSKRCDQVVTVSKEEKEIDQNAHSDSGKIAHHHS